MKISQELSINFNYDIYFSKNIFENDTLLKIIQKNQAQTMAFLIDDMVISNWPQLIEAIENYFQETDIEVKPAMIIPGGEQAKNNINDVLGLTKYFDKAKLDRQSIVIAIGGGAVLDLVGFAAAITHRGIKHIRIPTTVLAQNDGGIGVKNGINYLNKKNFLGTFTPPLAVINDAQFLTTLSNRDWRSGISEAIKVALLKDIEFFNWIKNNIEQLNNRDLKVMETLIYRCAVHHANHISKNGDPFERTSSRPLDFGHWSAHKIEQLSKFKINHGEAVAIGVLIDCAYSVEIGELNEDCFNKILLTFIKLGFKVYYSELLKKDSELNNELIDGLEEFREHLGGDLTIPLIKEIGVPFETNQIKINLLERAIIKLKESFHEA